MLLLRIMLFRRVALSQEFSFGLVGGWDMDSTFGVHSIFLGQGEEKLGRKNGGNVPTQLSWERGNTRIPLLV